MRVCDTPLLLVGILVLANTGAKQGCALKAEGWLCQSAVWVLPRTLGHRGAPGRAPRSYSSLKM